ncbi:MAG: peptidylprolyl isomerase, partial [Thermoanaerobaculia bacterium]
PEGLRARAARFLFRFDTDPASEAAMRLLSDSSSAVRQEAAYALSRRPFARAARQLELLLTDANVLTRAYAIAGIGRVAETASLPVVIAALGDTHPWVRTNAAVALRRLAEKDASIVRAEDLPRIFAATEDPDPGVRASIIETLGWYAAVNETARARLIDRATNGTAWERELAAGALAKHAKDAEILKQLGTLTPWQIVRVVENAPKVGPFDLFRTQNRVHPDALVRAAVLNAIPDDGVDFGPHLERIRAGLTDPDVIVRTTAIDRYRLSSADTPAVWLQTLEQLEQKERTSELNDARLAAINALAQWERPQRVTMLRSLLTDRDPVVRRVAADLIVEKLNANRPQYTPLPVTRTQREYEEIVRWSRQPHTATIHTSRGDIQLSLLPQDAPMTAWNFAQLAQKKFFDNTSFMRVVPNFVIQGGDPRNDMNGGPGYAIRDEINLHKYTRGAVGMALSGPDTGGSQFFITHSPQPHLDGGYTVFGQVIEGMDAVNRIARDDRIEHVEIIEGQ